MNLTRTLPASAGIGELQTYSCKHCGVWVTEASDIKNPRQGQCVWLTPNVHQLFFAYQPPWEDTTRPASAQKAPHGLVYHWLAWRPSVVHALAFGALFTWCVSNLSHVSEFLYFRF